MKLQVRIKERSWIAKFAALKLGSESVAIVIGSTIHLWNTTALEFVKNERWVCHELTHVQQYQQLGILNFIVQYLIESIRKGYRMNKFEVEARANEENKELLHEVAFI